MHRAFAQMAERGIKRIIAGLLFLLAVSTIGACGSKAPVADVPSASSSPWHLVSENVPDANAIAAPDDGVLWIAGGENVDSEREK